MKVLHDRMRSEYDFFVGESSEVLIVQPSSVTQKLWRNEFLQSILSSATKNQGLAFIHLVNEVVERKGKMIKTVETVSIEENTNANQYRPELATRWCIIGHVRLMPISLGHSLRI